MLQLISDKVSKIILLLIVCLMPSIGIAQTSGTAGLIYETYRGTGASPSINPLTYPTVLSTGTSANINYPVGSFGSNLLGSGRIDQVIVRWTGHINIPTTGTYYFGAQADDGFIVNINNTEVVNSWVDGSNTFRSGGAVTLTAGVYPIEVWYYENGGGQAMIFSYSTNGTSWTVVPSSMLATSANYWAATVAPSPVYRNSAITTIQSTRRASNLSAATGHQAEVTISGDANDVYILQAGSSGHFASVNIVGDTNRVEVKQNTLVGARHYLEASIVGNSNVLNLYQSGTDKTQIVNVNGSANTITTNQVGTGNHFLDLSVSGNNHNATVTQSGSGNHEARVTLDGTQPWNFNLTQQGSTSQKYTLPHDMSNGTVVNGTCMVIGGCNLTVNQQ